VPCLEYCVAAVILAALILLAALGAWTT